MNFSGIFLFFLAIILAVCTVTAAPEPRWKGFKKIEHLGQHIRDGIIKAGPAVAVVGEVSSIVGKK